MDDPMAVLMTSEQRLAERNALLLDTVKKLEVENRELEAENAQLRDSIVQMVRRMQEVVTWNELDAPRRREDDDE